MNPSPAIRSVLLVVAAIAALPLAACEDDGPLSPPTLHCGRDTCAECGMIINEAKFAAAIIVDNDGVREHQLFDDVGDLFDYESAHPDLKILARYVQDFAGAGWIPADAARYLASKDISTPMGSGLVAFAPASGPPATSGKPPAPTLGLAEARETRAAHRRERLGH